MTSGFRLARAEYSAAVSPAGPDPMTMTLWRDIVASDLQPSTFSLVSYMFVDHLLERVLVGEPDDLLDDLAAFEEQQRWDPTDAEAAGHGRIVVDVEFSNRHATVVIRG